MLVLIVKLLFYFAYSSTNSWVTWSQGPHFFLKKSLPTSNTYHIIFRIAVTGFKTWLCHLLTLWTWIKHLALWLSFLICEMEIIVPVLYQLTKNKKYFFGIVKKCHQIPLHLFLVFHIVVVIVVVVVVNDVSPPDELNHSWAICLPRWTGNTIQWPKELT